MSFNTQITKNKVVEIVDSCMGSSKSTNALKYMDNNPHQRYIYVSPLLTEIDIDGRVPNSLNNIEIFSPTDESGTKGEHLLELIKQGCNVCCSHSLYSSLTDKHFNQIAVGNYVVLIDEEINVIGGFDNYSDSDIQWLIEKGDVSISEQDGMVSWVGDKSKITKEHKYYEFLKCCESGVLYSSKRSSTMMVTQLPIRLFECAKRVIILTYLFKDNILDSFLRLKGFEVKDCKDIVPNIVNKEDFKKLLNIIPPSKKMLNHKLNATWWSEANGEMIKEVKNFTETSCKKLGVKGDDVLWTVPKERAVKMNNRGKILFKPRNYTVDSKGNSCYLASSIRATNDYAHKTTMVHLINRYPLVCVSAYLQDYDCKMDANVFALSEMLQWLWRGCIRKGEPMNVVIGSERMYWLFMNWLYDYGVSPKQVYGKSYSKEIKDVQ